MSADLTRINILLVEDDDGDSFLMSEMFEDIADRNSEHFRFSAKRAKTLAEAVSLAQSISFDVVLLDLGLPDSLGIDTLNSFLDRRFNLPVIVLTGLDDEAASIMALKSGAQDYIVKGRFDSHSLARAVRYAIERFKLLSELEQSLKEIKVLQGFLPICAWCKKIRDDQGYWNQLESYISTHTGATISHGICPDCLTTMKGELKKV